MKSVCRAHSYIEQKEAFRDDYFYCSINYMVQQYRSSFLKRKNINRYQRMKRGTPLEIEIAINALDRKIKGLSIFTDEVKSEYFKGLNAIFEMYYESLNENRPSRYDAYIKYLGVNHTIYKKKYIDMSLSFKEFVKRGMSNNYR